MRRSPSRRAIPCGDGERRRINGGASCDEDEDADGCCCRCDEAITSSAFGSGAAPRSLAAFVREDVEDAMRACDLLSDETLRKRCEMAVVGRIKDIIIRGGEVST